MENVKQDDLIMSIIFSYWKYINIYISFLGEESAKLSNFELIYVNSLINLSCSLGKYVNICFLNKYYNLTTTTIKCINFFIYLKEYTNLFQFYI